mgnify:CR=1 FL=1
MNEIRKSQFTLRIEMIFFAKLGTLIRKIESGQVFFGVVFYSDLDPGHCRQKKYISLS